MVTPVQFQGSVEYMISAGADYFAELGPGKTLIGLVKKNAKALSAKVSVFRTDKLDELSLAIDAAIHEDGQH